MDLRRLVSYAGAMPNRTRYALVGAGSRAAMYIDALLGDYRDVHELVGLCDSNQARMDAHNHRIRTARGLPPIPTYQAGDFARMLREQRVDGVIVTSKDSTHDRYLITAMELGCDCVTEKPMTIDAQRCQAVLDAVARTGRRLRVAFNYRYAPRASAVKRLIADGAIGEPISAHFEWLLDTRHGADYFRRWHRDRDSSGGLMVHKATHHFDLVNWWLAARPETVVGFGGLRFYGAANARRRGMVRADAEPFALDLTADAWMRALYHDAAREDGYRRDQDVFGEGITIEDDMALAVRYDTGATLSYHLTAYSPWEGLRFAVNGSKGRLELEVVENPSCAGPEDPAQARLLAAGKPIPEGARERLVVQPHWGQAREMPIAAAEGGHGGGDALLLDDLFGAPGADPLQRAAGHLDGAWSILTGIAANRSFATGAPVRVADLVRMPASSTAPAAR
jgi:predicted dehydrogenase